MKEQVVYVEQYGYVWKLTLDEWKAICRAGLAGEGYVLPSCRELAGRPKWLRRERGGNKAGYWVLDGTKKFVQPLDWKTEEFREELERLGEKVDG